MKTVAITTKISIVDLDGDELTVTMLQFGLKQRWQVLLCLS